MRLKLIKIIFLLLIGCSIYCQGSFKINNGKLYWEKEFVKDYKKDDLIKKIEFSSIEELNIKEDYITGYFLIDEIVTGMKYPIFMSSSQTKGKVIIEHLDTGYRVTIKDIKLIYRYDAGFIVRGDEDMLEEFVVKKKTKFSKQFLKHYSLYEDAFIELTDF